MRPIAVAVLGGALLGASCADRTSAPLEPNPAPLPSLSAAPPVIVNEVMADPSATGDDTGEWFEVHNRGSASVDLKGWTIASNNDAPHTVSTSVTVPAGGYAVLARNGDKKKNGGVTVSYAYGTALALANGGDWLALRDAGGAPVDSVAWGGSVPSGAARGVQDPSAAHADLLGANWTTQTSTYGKGDRGTPGAVNDGYVEPVPQPASVTVTPSSASVAVGGTQQFAASAEDESGSPVETTYTWASADPAIATVDQAGLATAVSAGTVLIRATAANGVYGEATLTVTTADGGGGSARLLVNEVMPNPSAVTDDVGEWLEVHNWGDGPADLQGWTIASNNDAPHTIAASVPVPAGGYAVLARNGSTSQNGGVTAAYTYGTGITLANSSDWIALRGPDGATVDSVAWSSTPTGAARGVADPSADNTDVGGSNWTTQTSTYGSGDKGTPGGVNDGYVSPVPPGEPATVVVTPSTASVAVGASQLFTASATDANGKATSATYTWSSSSPAVATVDASGTATAQAEGTATIRATAQNGVYGEATLTVTAGGGGGGTGTEVVVRVLDIGQGDANLIRNGTNVALIDGGPDTTRMRQHLDAEGLRGDTIDVVILSHQHYDHHSGLRELFKASNGITVRYFFENQDAYTNGALSELRDSIRARASRGELIYRDTDDPCGDGRAVCTVTMNGGAKLHVMRPNPAGSSPNDRSTPVKLVGPDSASFSMWFAGDAEHEAIDWFDAGANYDVAPGMKVNVLKADHHGSCNGVKSRYVELLSPDWVTFSLADSNTYGHVHDQTKELFTQYGKPWYRTDQNGTITIRSPGTAGGGYTMSVERGSASSTGPSDRASSQTQCQSL